MFASNNPIIPRKGVCDPHIHIFNNRAYLYASHDLSPENNDWIMEDWQIWSSADLVNWEYETTIRPEDTYIGKYNKCWATDAAFKDGKYYFYFSKANLETGVMVSDSPACGFADVLKKPLLTEDLTPTRQYDPTVYIDDDEEKTPYIIFGSPRGNGYYIARLGNDMMSLAEEPRSIKIDDGYAKDDKSFLHKYNNKYYLSWASFYAISDNIYGPYRYVGNIGASQDHGSFFEWNNQWFNAFTIFDPTYYYRSTGLCYIHYRENGEMVADPLIVEYGVGQYNAQWNKIEAEWYMAAENIAKAENKYEGFDITAAKSGGYIKFPNIYNLRKNSSISFFAANRGLDDIIIEIREEGPEGVLLGECTVENTGLYDFYMYRVFSCDLKNKEGKNNICFVIKGENPQLFRLDWLKFF